MASRSLSFSCCFQRTADSQLLRWVIAADFVVDLHEPARSGAIPTDLDIQSSHSAPHSAEDNRAIGKAWLSSPLFARRDFSLDDVQPVLGAFGGINDQFYGHLTLRRAKIRTLLNFYLSSSMINEITVIGTAETLRLLRRWLIESYRSSVRLRTVEPGSSSAKVVPIR